MLRVHIRRGDIVLVNLEGAEGNEQKGTRPAVIIQNDVGNRHSPTTIVCPISRKKPALPCHLLLQNGSLKSVSTVLCEQIRTIGLHRIVAKIGKLTGEELQELDRCLQIAVGLDPHYNERHEDEIGRSAL